MKLSVRGDTVTFMPPASLPQADDPRRPHRDPTEPGRGVHSAVRDDRGPVALPTDAEPFSWAASRDPADPRDHESANVVENHDGERALAGGREDPYPTVEEEGNLGDLDGLANELFNTWRDGSETRWAAYMWSILKRAGLTTYQEWDEASRTLVVCRLIALAGINREFAARAWGEGYPGEWRESVILADLLGEYPLLDEVAVGRLAERTGVVADFDPFGGNRESATSLLCEIADDEWPTVIKALTDHLGDSWLFASLWMTRDGDARYPLPDKIIENIVNAPTSEMIGTFPWVSDGCNWPA